MYENRWGVDENNSTAVESYHKAAEQGHADAQFNLGEMYEQQSKAMMMRNFILE